MKAIRVIPESKGHPSNNRLVVTGRDLQFYEEIVGDVYELNIECEYSIEALKTMELVHRIYCADHCSCHRFNLS